jgi:two-component system NtrC family sensor kinase
MSSPPSKQTGIPSGKGGRSGPHHPELFKRTLLHLILIYLVPFLLLTTYYHSQSLYLRDEGIRNHLRSIAEYQAHTLDLFIRERVVNLRNLIDNPKLEVFPSQSTLADYLQDLKRASGAFVDLDVFDRSGRQLAYTGPFPVVEQRDYSAEQWFRDLLAREGRFVITDIYLGFRGRPHFTVAVGRPVEGEFLALRATLDPERIYDFITSLEGARDVQTSIVNRSGTYQVVTPNLATPLADSAIVPAEEPRIGIEEVRLEGERIVYGYAWLGQANWALITQGMVRNPPWYILGGDYRIALAALLIIGAILWATVARARKTVQLEEERDETKIQLAHSAKLASVGELAGGIAHEINNPLAIISEEAGLMKDLMSGQFGRKASTEELVPRLDNIQKAVFRCRDITRKLLGFVRRTEVKLAPHDLRELMDEVVDDFFLREMKLSNIEIRRDFAEDLPAIQTDGNQLRQVFFNILKNAADAIEGAGRIEITIRRDEQNLRIAIQDTGSGMSRQQLEQVFMPFFTTKEVGKGTGLGLSVSYGIIQGLGGEIEVESRSGVGSTFTVVLPIR